MNNPAAILAGFAIKNLPKCPLSEQVELYRALAATCGTTEERATYLAEAERCEAILADLAAHEERHEQLALNFRARTRARKASR